MPDGKTWSIIVHGGARKIKEHEKKASRDGVRNALARGAEVLEAGGSALDAVEAAIKQLELDVTFNAGYGSVKRTNGEVQMDASVMDGETLDIGAVSAIQHVPHPVSVARALLRDKIVLMTGSDATAYARKKGFEYRDMTKEETDAHEPSDTVGCVARDIKGNIVIGISTGGDKNMDAGRVGDAPMPGCGFYADNARGGVCCSGEGEKNARVMLAARAIQGMDVMDAEAALEKAVSSLERVKGEGGCIAIDRHGRPAWAHNSPQFAVAYQTSGAAPAVFLEKTEEKS